MILGVHHFSLSVTDLDRTIEFYTKVLGITHHLTKINEAPGLGRALFGAKWGVDRSEARLRLAIMDVGGTRVEFIQYLDPAAQPFHRNPSYAGSAHIAFKVEDIEGMVHKLKEAGVEFHTPVQSFMEKENKEWKWCYFRDPDGIILELVEEIHS
jgi:catechol 2,3-dioxygenase-like lactoylglutathione lyase family enzyme